MGVCACLHMCGLVYIYVYVHIFGGPSLMSGIIPIASPVSFRQSFPSDPELIGRASLNTQLALGILSPLPEAGLQNGFHARIALECILGIQPLVLTLA